MSEIARRIRDDQRGGAVRLVLAIVAAVAVVGIGGWVWNYAQTEAAEREKIAEVLALQTGSVVADVGAGDGDWTVDMAARVGTSGHIYSTEVNPERLEDIRDAVDDAGLDNVTVITGTATSTGLEAGCCDAILLRTVYHHFTDPSPMNQSMYQSLRPGGLLAVIDFIPGSIVASAPAGTPERRGGHGVPTDQLVEEITAAGFELVSEIEDYPGRNYCYLFRRPAGP